MKPQLKLLRIYYQNVVYKILPLKISQETGDTKKVSRTEPTQGNQKKQKEKKEKKKKPIESQRFWSRTKLLEPPLICNKIKP